MAVSITTEPTYIIPGRAAEIIASCSVGNWVDVVLTSAPSGSKWQKRLDEDDAAEIQLWSIQSGKKHTFTFDVPGRYACTLREITKSGVNFKGGYAGDPDGYQTETVVGTTSYSFVVGQRLTGTIRLGNESGTLNLFVWDSTIRATTVPIHGEVTPRIDTTTEKMKVAAASTTVTTALSALDGVAASTAVSSLDTVANDIRSKFNAHIANATPHSAADSDNSISADYVGGSNATGLSETIREINAKMRYHFTNDAAGTGVGTGSYHTTGDWDNLPAVTGANDALTSGIALASLWHSYETHRADTGVHSSADVTNTLTALPKLLDVWRTVISVVTSDNPTAPTTDNPGAVTLVHRAGLVKA